MTTTTDDQHPSGFDPDRNYTTRDRLPFGIDPNHNYTTNEAAAEVLRCKPCTLESQRCNGGGPRFVKAGRRVLYPGSFLIEYMESRTVQNTQKFGRNGE